MPDERPAAETCAPRRIVERPAPESVSELSKSLSPRMARIYSARGVNSMDQLDLALGALLLPRALDGAAHAAGLLADAVIAGRHIRFVGDFDADGATSSVVGVAALRAMGCARVSFIVPNRFEFGYGLTPEIVAIAMADHPDVLVTVDNGISSIEGVRAARAAGAMVIITDHHLPGREMPDADAIVNPNLPGCAFGSPNLAGVGVIFYVLTLLRTELRERGWFERIGIEPPNMADFLDLVSLGTVADVVPLDHNNRILVQQGLRRIRAGKARPGIRALCEAAGRPMATLSAADLGFGLAPRLNAAGRLDDMSIGIRCLLADNLIEARSLATALEELNESRKAIQQQMTHEAELSVATIDLAGQTQLGLCVYREGWHQGVVGIVAGRLKDRFARPVIAFADAGATAPDELRGSARSIPGVHIRDAIDAIATRYPGLIRRFGGHAMAAGLSIRRMHLQRFTDAFATEIGQWVTADEIGGIILSDGDLAGSELELSLADEIARGGPWGQGFPEPLFHGDFDVVNQRVVGERHLKLSLRKNARVVDAIAFNQAPLDNAQRARVAYRLSRNDYQDRATLQLVVEHIARV
ncbi:MAG TPA: single-stranded-DNA-specific exonuclease RecJ [Pseudomonadales bacterium]|nr:single-stranded-DNA-specific exonuclease RecJ [Pseudomonadales bacterium]